jgi:hypothetical protein
MNAHLTDQIGVLAPSTDVSLEETHAFVIRVIPRALVASSSLFLTVRRSSTPTTNTMRASSRATARPDPERPHHGLGEWPPPMTSAPGKPESQTVARPAFSWQIARADVPAAASGVPTLLGVTVPATPVDPTAPGTPATGTLSSSWCS